MHDVLSNPCRCAILQYLQEAKGSVEVGEIVGHVAKRCRSEERGWTGAIGGGRRRQNPGPRRDWLLESRVRTMDEFGLSRYDPV